VIAEGDCGVRAGGVGDRILEAGWGIGIGIGGGGGVLGFAVLCKRWITRRWHGDGRVAAAARRVERNMRLARAVSVTYCGSVSHLAAAPAVQPAAGFQQLPGIHIVSR
jgi:hypothetical protein